MVAGPKFRARSQITIPSNDGIQSRHNTTCIHTTPCLFTCVMICPVTVSLSECARTPQGSEASFQDGGVVPRSVFAGGYVGASIQCECPPPHENVGRGCVRTHDRGKKNTAKTERRRDGKLDFRGEHDHGDRCAPQHKTLKAYLGMCVWWYKNDAGVGVTGTKALLRVKPAGPTCSPPPAARFKREETKAHGTALT